MGVTFTYVVVSSTECLIFVFCVWNHSELHWFWTRFWPNFSVLCQTSQTASLSVLQLVVAVRYPIIYAFVCQVDSGSWDTEIQDDVGLHMHRRTGAGGTAPVRFSLCVMQWQ